MSFCRFVHRISEEGFKQIFMGPRQYVRTDQLAHLGSRFGAGIHSRFHAADIPAAQHCNQAAADRYRFHEADIRRFDHRVTGFHAADITFGFDHS